MPAEPPPLHSGARGFADVKASGVCSIKGPMYPKGLGYRVWGLGSFKGSFKEFAVYVGLRALLRL